MCWLIFVNTQLILILTGRPTPSVIIRTSWVNNSIQNNVFIVQGFRTIVFIFIIMFTTFRPIFLQSSSGVCWTQVPTRNFEPRPIFNPQGSLVLIPLIITAYKCLVFLYCCMPAVRIEPATSWWLSFYKLREPTTITLTLCVLLESSDWLFWDIYLF